MITPQGVTGCPPPDVLPAPPPIGWSTGFFATPDANANLNTNLKDVVGSTLWIEQLKAMGLTIVMAVVGTVVLTYAVKAAFGLRPSKDDEEAGLDGIDHGESGYHYEEAGT